MNPIGAGILGVVVLLALLACGLPVGFGMILVGFAGFAYLVSPGAALTKMASSAYISISDYNFTVLSLFILMAEVAFVAGLSKDLYNLAAKWLGHLPGGIAIATIGACAVFAAVSSSSVATAVTMGLVALPEMKKYNYDPRLATGTVAAGGTLGILIPPSGVLIIYGIITEQSIGRLFIAGIVPGIILAIMFMIMIYIRGQLNPNLCPRGPKSAWKEKFTAFGSCGEIILLIMVVLGGLIIGWFTPTEAGAVGAFGAILFSLVRRRLSWHGFKEALLVTARTSGLIYTILVGAFIFNYFLTVSTIPAQLANIVGGFALPPLAVMGVIILVYMVLGCFVDAAAMVLLTVPVFFPLALRLGFDPIWFGIIIVVVVEMAMITPPVGVNVYAISGIAKDVPMADIFKGIFPFFYVLVVFIIILLFVPQLATFLPNIMM